MSNRQVNQETTQAPGTAIAKLLLFYPHIQNEVSAKRPLCTWETYQQNEKASHSQTESMPSAVREWLFHKSGV